MQQKIDSARSKAMRAREKALMCGDHRLKEEWLLVARTWEELVAEFREFRETKSGA
ncbi:MAG TPA: hypothetical protein VGK90_02100 [Rhizomicrobium sp.]|jgi:hypothetical protein